MQYGLCASISHTNGHLALLFTFYLISFLNNLPLAFPVALLVTLFAVLPGFLLLIAGRLLSFGESLAIV